MAPRRGDVSQRSHDEQPLMGARMRQDQVRLVQHQPAMRYEVEIERARSVRCLAATTEPGLDAAERNQGLMRR